jgi:hypothetical protein
MALLRNENWSFDASKSNEICKLKISFNLSYVFACVYGVAGQTKTLAYAYYCNMLNSL